MSKKYRILVSSDATNSKTGYARVASKVLEALHSSGHTVAQLGWFHSPKPALRKPWATLTTYKNHAQCCGRGSMICEVYQEGKIRYIGLDKNHLPVSRDNDGVFCGKGQRIERDKYGHDSMNLATAIFKPDIVISIGDQWMCQPAQESQLRSTYFHIMYAAVDGEPLPKFTRVGGHHLDWEDLYEKVDLPIAYCDWAKDTINAMVERKCVTRVIPFGVNLETFKNLNYEKRHHLRVNDRRFLSVCRSRGGVLWESSRNAKNDFNVLYVGRNIQRKNIPFILETIHKFKTLGFENPDRPVKLLFHSPYHDNGWNMDELIRQYEAYDWIKVNPRIRPGEGPDDNELNEIYNMADVHLHMSAAEGFDLPCLESLAAGVITTSMNFSAPPSWGKDALFLIDPIVIRQEPVTNLGRAYPDVDQAARLLKRIYDMSKEEKIDAWARSRRLANQYSWNAFRHNWISLIEDLDL